jgi:hypothetical protein
MWDDRKNLEFAFKLVIVRTIACILYVAANVTTRFADSIYKHSEIEPPK